MSDPTPAELLDEAAQGPAAAAVDGQSATAQRLLDLIEYAKFKAAQTAATSGGPGFSIRKIRGSQFES